MKKIFTSILLSATPFIGLLAQTGMGIGTNNPAEKLEVVGAIKLGTTTSTNAGTIRWNGSNFQGYDGSAWIDLDGGGGGADTDWTISGINQYSAVSGNVGIGIAVPTSKLEVAGQIKITGGTPGANKVLTSDGAGLATWETPAAAISLEDDNADTKIQVEESTDEDKIRFDTEGTERMIIDAAGNVGIGISAPLRLMHLTQPAGSKLLVGRNGATTTNDVLGELQFDGSSPGGGVSSTDASVVIRATAAEAYDSDNKGASLSFLTKAIDGNATALATERMRISSQGNVGIGTSTPISKLDVDGGDVALNDGQIRLRAGNDANHYLSYIGGAFDGAKLTGNDNVILNTITGGDALIVKGNRVGIGTPSPIAPLHVEATSDPSYGNFTFYAKDQYTGNPNNPSSCCGGTVNGVSIHSAGRVMATEFDAYSDARIKNVVGITNSSADLTTLLDIEITDYSMIDKAKDVKPYKKVIAQQVETVFPSAVSKITDVVPDIYQVAKAENGKIQLATDVKVGDRVKLIFEDATEIATVTAADANAFTVDLEKSGDVFVYGREVKDFRTVDYEAISMLNVSATQELYRMILSLQQENEEVQKELEGFTSLRSEIEMIKEAIGIDMQTSK